MTRSIPSRVRLLVTVGVIVGLTVLIYHLGYRSGRHAGVRDITVDSIAESLRAKFTDAEEPMPVGEAYDPFAASNSALPNDPFSALPNDPFSALPNDPFGGAQGNPFDGSGQTGLDDPFSNSSFAPSGNRVLTEVGEPTDSLAPKDSSE